MEKQTGISLLVKIESSYLNCRSSAVRPHLGARIDAILSGFSSTHLASTRLCSFPAYVQSVLHVPFAVQAACHGEPSVVCRPPRQNLCKSHSGLSGCRACLFGFLFILFGMQLFPCLPDTGCGQVAAFSQFRCLESCVAIAKHIAAYHILLVLAQMRKVRL